MLISFSPDQPVAPSPWPSCSESCLWGCRFGGPRGSSQCLCPSHWGRWFCWPPSPRGGRLASPRFPLGQVGIPPREHLSVQALFGAACFLLENIRKVKFHTPSIFYFFLRDENNLVFFDFRRKTIEKLLRGKKWTISSSPDGFAVTQS